MTTTFKLLLGLLLACGIAPALAATPVPTPSADIASTSVPSPEHLAWQRVGSPLREA
ncbi:MAG: hypothetical protein FJ209_13285 [Betaproteobacteria bacterium]|nr:hypothetical protein [Betaproteobacteria bacterium]